MNNFLKPGKTMTYTAPAGGVVSGSVYLLGGLFVVAADTVAATFPFDGATEGVFTLSKTTGEGALSEGQPLYWDVTNARTTIDHTIGFPIGTVATIGGQLTGDTTVQCRLHGLSLVGKTMNLRKRITTAQVNAGFTLLPAIPGCKYRLIDAFAIAVGGAMTSNTDADLKATQASSVIKLVAWAQATMTQSTLVRAGAAGAAILADGASFVSCDANTAVTVGNTGSAITVMTNLDVEVTYQIEAL